MLLRRLFSTLLCFLILSPPTLAVTKTPFGTYGKPAAQDAAEILGISAQVARLKELSENPQGNIQEQIALRTIIVRKILRGMLEVRQACNKLDVERAYTYDIMQKEERRQQFVAKLFNTANFAQLSTFYTLEPFMRIHKQFVTSAIFTTTSGSLGTAISTFSRLHGSLAKASNVAPPAILNDIVDGGPIDTSGLPPLVTKYLDAKAPNADKTRRDLLFANWMQNYKIDASKKENLCAINDKKKASIQLLKTRILLLWSLHTFIQDFDRQLLALLKHIKSSSSKEKDDNLALSSANSALFSAGTTEMARSLKLTGCLNQIQMLKQIGSENLAESDQWSQLQLQLLERSMEGALELQVASDRVDEDLYYNYHIALSDLLQRRAKWLQYTYDANFIQNGVLGIVAGRLYLSRKSFDGDRMFVIGGSNGTALTTLAMLQMRGGKRKADSSANSLAEVLNLSPDKDDRFSEFVSNLLNAPPPGSSDGKSRRELLNEAWKKANVTTMNLDSQKNKSTISSMPTHKFDTIKIIRNRIVLLHSLKKELESLQAEVLDLLHSTE